MAMRLHLDPPRCRQASPLSVRGTLRVRHSVSVQLRDDRNHVGRGEAVPLPGYSRDGAAVVEAVLARITGAASGWTVAEAPVHLPAALQGGAGAARAAWLDDALAPWGDALGACVGARFALECALVDLLSRRAGLPAAHWLAAGRALQPVPVSLLLPDDDGAAIDAARAGAGAGFTVLKLKVARADRPDAQEDALLTSLRRAIDATDATVRLRLDANGALAPASAAARLTAWRSHGVELVEEPVAGAALLALPPLPLPWAADESLAEVALAERLLAMPAARRPAAFVLKPAELGLARCLRLADAAALQGLGLIVTHGLDGDLGHAAACALAAAMPRPPWPCGLAAHPGLRRPPPGSPWLPVPVVPGLGLIDDDGDLDGTPS